MARTFGVKQGQLQVASGSFLAVVVTSSQVRKDSPPTPPPLTPHLIERPNSDFTESQVAEDPTSKLQKPEDEQETSELFVCHADHLVEIEKLERHRRPAPNVPVRGNDSLLKGGPPHLQIQVNRYLSTSSFADYHLIVIFSFRFCLSLHRIYISTS